MSFEDSNVDSIVYQFLFSDNGEPNPIARVSTEFVAFIGKLICDTIKTLKSSFCGQIDLQYTVEDLIFKMETIKSIEEIGEEALNTIFLLNQEEANKFLEEVDMLWEIC